MEALNVGSLWNRIDGTSEFVYPFISEVVTSANRSRGEYIPDSVDERISEEWNDRFASNPNSRDEPRLGLVDVVVADNCRNNMTQHTLEYHAIPSSFRYHALKDILGEEGIRLGIHSAGAVITKPIKGGLECAVIMRSDDLFENPGKLSTAPAAFKGLKKGVKAGDINYPLDPNQWETDTDVILRDLTENFRVDDQNIQDIFHLDSLFPIGMANCGNPITYYQASLSEDVELLPTKEASFVGKLFLDRDSPMSVVTNLQMAADHYGMREDLVGKNLDFGEHNDAIIRNGFSLSPNGLESLYLTANLMDYWDILIHSTPTQKFKLNINH
jgi:hypothetical protein